MTTHQTLSAGMTLTEEWASQLGAFSGVSMPCHPTHAIMVVAGHSGHGKSTFFRSCPYAYVVNADCSSASEVTRALVWPGIRSDGTLVSANPSHPGNVDAGIPLGTSLTWPLIEEKKKILIQMAHKNVPNRPRIVVLDTVDLAYRLVQAWMVQTRNAELASKGSPPVSDFNELYGKSAWPESYAHIMNFIFDLRNAGYGVGLVYHLGNKDYYEGDSKKRLTNVPLVPDNLWNNVYKHAEIVACVEQKFIKKPVAKILRDAKGNPVLDPQTKEPRTTTVVEEVTEHHLTFESGSLSTLTKKRAEMPSSILLSKQNPWADFENAYNLALAASKGPTP